MVVHHETPVLIVGAGPSGLIAALQLSAHGVRSMLVERNLDTTKWPKMDITNCRSMELFKRLNVDQGLREVGVPQNYSFDVHFSSGLSDGGERITKWDLPSPNWWREHIKANNDGSMPREPYQRCSQAIFEAWLKPRIQANPLVKSFWGMKFESLSESDSGVECELTDTEGEKHVVKAQYVIGCDGGGSRVRRCIGLKLEGGPVPALLYLVHFKSRDLSRIQRQGQFWHIYFAGGQVIISQDEVDTWTVHTVFPADFDTTTLDPKEAVYKALGGVNAPFPIEIDEILVTSAWRPNIYLADKYVSAQGRVFLSGDAAHQNIPTGGYGMNTAVGDSFDIGWKLAAVLSGYAGPTLLRSFETERRPVAARNIEHSGVHWQVIMGYHALVGEAGADLTAQTAAGAAARAKIAAHLSTFDGENKDQGIELGYRYTDSPVVVHGADDPPAREPRWERRSYVPSTWPGARAPHVFLRDGETSVFDLFGTAREFTIVDFTADARYAPIFQAEAKKRGVPLKAVHLPDEPHVRKIWERDAVLVRPDDHVAWRSSAEAGDAATKEIDVENIFSVVLGHEAVSADVNGALKKAQNGEHEFTGTVGNVKHEEVSGLAEFQR